MSGGFAKMVVWPCKKGDEGAADAKEDDLAVQRISPEIQVLLRQWARRARETTRDKRTERQRKVFSPDSSKRISWDVFMLLLMIWTIFEIPVSLIYYANSPMECGFKETTAAINFMADLLFLSDVVLNFHTAYYDEQEQALVFDRERIARNYMRSWFVLDISSSVPADQILCMIGLGGSMNSNVWRSIKVLRLLKLARLLKFQRVLKRWSMMTGNKSVSNTLRFVKFGSIMLFSAHLAACFWMLVGRATCDADFECEDNWLQSYDEKLYDSRFDDNTIFSRYLVSLYFSVVTLSTVGYGDINPVNDIERVYALLLAMAGAMVFAWCIGSISELASQENTTEKEIERSIREVADFMKYRNVPAELQMRVRSAVSHAARKAPHHVHRCLDIVPTHLRAELMLNSSLELIGGVKLFATLDTDAKAVLASLLRPVYLRPNERLYESLQTGSEMFFVVSGFLHLLNHQGHTSERIAPGEFAGEVVMFDDLLSLRAETAVANGTCECLALRKDDFDLHIKSRFPDIYQAVKDVAIWRQAGVDMEELAEELKKVSKGRTVPVHQRKEHLKAINEAVRNAHTLDGHSGKGRLHKKRSSLVETVRLLRARSKMTDLGSPKHGHSHEDGPSYQSSPMTSPLGNKETPIEQATSNVDLVLCNISGGEYITQGLLNPTNVVPSEEEANSRPSVPQQAPPMPPAVHEGLLGVTCASQPPLPSPVGRSTSTPLQAMVSPNPNENNVLHSEQVKGESARPSSGGVVIGANPQSPEFGTSTNPSRIEEMLVSVMQRLDSMQAEIKELRESKECQFGGADSEGAKLQMYGYYNARHQTVMKQASAAERLRSWKTDELSG